MVAECPICVKRCKLYACGSCDFEACRRCLQRWAIESDQCPSCKRVRPFGECQKTLSVTFCRTHMRRRDDEWILQTELSRLPATHVAARHVQLRREMYAIQREMTTCIRLMRDDPTDEVIDMYRSLNERMVNVRLKQMAHTRTSFVACSRAACAGYVVEGTCSSCGDSVCTKCGAKKAPDHVCDDDDVRSHRTIQNECRKCPRCSAWSSRTEGCPTMWCANCHCFWDWNTARVLRGVPHNPDHRLWMKTQTGNASPREAADLPCGGIVETPLFREAVVRKWNTDDEDKDACERHLHAVNDARSCIIHAHDLHLTRYNPNADPCQDTRIRYILGDFGRESFKRRVVTRTRKEMLHARIAEVLQMFTFVGIDVLLRFCHTSLQAEAAAKEMEAVRHIVNDAMRALSLEFGQKTPHISKKYTWKLPYARKLQRSRTA